MTRSFLCTPTEPVVQTTQGKVRGFRLDGTYTFYGIPYADAGRFQAPHPVPAWEGVRDALSYGYVCPLMEQDVPNKEQLVPHRYWPMDEHCLSLNIWSPTLDAGAGKPVMVWLHGGGYFAGSSIEHAAYEGDNLSAWGDVVVVSVNHRLNILGYLDLSEFGEKYANSANAGHADLVAALEWIRDNIAAFGGDPGNVTLFGQSGGGEKIQDLMNIPAADGLFHKGIIQSGATKFTYSKADGGPLVRAMLDYLGLRETEAEQLEILPYPRLVEAYKAVARACFKKNGYLGCSPAVNGWYLGTPRETGFTEHARTIPLMVGSVMGEFCFEAGVQNKYGLTEAETMPLLEKKYGALAGKIAELFKAAYPGKHLSDALYLDTYFRVPTRKLIRRLAEEGKAPVYAWRLTYDFPIDGGKVAWHCSDVPFAFHNTCRTPLFNVPGETDRLEERICGAFVSFARYGDPNTGALPAWPPCTAGDEATMIFDKVCEVRHNFDNALVDTLEESGATPNLPMADTLLGPEDGNAVLVVH